MMSMVHDSYNSFGTSLSEHYQMFVEKLVLRLFLPPRHFCAKEGRKIHPYVVIHLEILVEVDFLVELDIVVSR